jgi:hypothetical protein
LSILAIDPVVVHYDDPELTKLEKQLAIAPAQKDQFDDIVVKYRDTGIAGNNAGSTGRQRRKRPSRFQTSSDKRRAQRAKR